MTAAFRAHSLTALWGPPWAAVWVCAPPWASMGCRATTCLTMVFITGCRTISAPVPPPSSSLTLVYAGLFLSHVSHLSLLAAVQRFLHILKRAITETPPASLTG